MMFSITFGFDAAGKFPVDFGAINRDGGERRLNVAITRARHQLVVFASFLPEQFRAQKSVARGIHDLKAFLEYAEKGAKAIIARAEGSLGGHESPLEEAVAAALEEWGWRVEPQVGVSGFRIDMGIVHPNKPGAYLAGIECDGATYHRSAVARDRDKIRQQVLENLGWSIVRVWSADWWYAPEAAIEQLDAKLRELLRRGREEDRLEESPVPEEPQDEIVPAVDAIPDSPTITDSNRDSRSPVTEGLESAEPTSRPQLFAKQPSANTRHLYARADLGNAADNQSRFFDDDYSDVLRRMALSVLNVQGPIRDDALARELARAHGFARTGNRIKDRVLHLLPNVIVTEASVGRFLWPGSQAQDSIPFRYSTDDADRRSLDEIPLAELIGLVREHPLLAASDDPAIALAREIGLARLARGARARLEEALAACDDLL